MNLGYIIGVLGLFGIGFGVYQMLRFRDLRSYLRARVAIYYKGRAKMDPTLNELIGWALALKPEEKGRQFYKMGQTTIGILKPLPRPRAKEKTHTLKDAA